MGVKECTINLDGGISYGCTVYSRSDWPEFEPSAVSEALAVFNISYRSPSEIDLGTYGFGRVMIDIDYGKEVISVATRAKTSSTSIGPSGYIQNGTGYIGGGGTSTVTSNYSEVTVQSQSDKKRFVCNEFRLLPLKAGDVVLPIFANYYYQSNPRKSEVVAAIIEGTNGVHQLSLEKTLIEIFELKAGIFGSVFQGKKDVTQALTTGLPKAFAACEYRVELARDLGGYTRACMLLQAFEKLAAEHGYDPRDIVTATAYIDIKEI